MVMVINTPNTAPQPHRVLRALWFEGKFRKPGGIVKLPRLLAVELRSAGKVEQAEDTPAKPAKAASKPEGDGQPS